MESILTIVSVFAALVVAAIICYVIWMCLCRTAKTSSSPENPPEHWHWQTQYYTEWQRQHRQHQGHGGLQFLHSDLALNPGAQWQEWSRRHQTSESQEMTNFGVVSEFQNRVGQRQCCPTTSVLPLVNTTVWVVPDNVRGGQVRNLVNNNIQRVPSAESDYPPPFFLSLERDILLPEKATRRHIFVPENLTPDSIQEGALRISEKRAQVISRNTVFIAPQKWHAWKTKRGPRIVSSERVVTVQCERKGGRGTFFVASVDMKYAIFTHDGHLMIDETLQS